jgi:hypothetical protein
MLNKNNKFLELYACHLSTVVLLVMNRFLLMPPATAIYLPAARM